MARALTGDELTALRSDGQICRLFLAFDELSDVFVAQLNGTPSSNDQVHELTYDNGDERYADAIAGMSVFVYDSSSNYKDKVRLRGTLSGNSGTMKIGEASHVDWADDDYLVVMDDFDLWARHVYIDDDGNVYMDREVAYSDQHENCDPVPVLGPDAVVWLTGDTVDVDFDASDSWVIGSTISAYAWSAPGCDSITDDDTDTPVITYAEAGRYWVICEVTAANGKSFTGYRRVFVFDADYMPATAFRLNSCNGDFERGGWQYSITLFADADFGPVRDRAFVILFARDWYDGEEISIGPEAGRENVVCAGWIVGESIEWDPEQGSVTFDVQGPQGKLDVIPGFPMGVEDCGESPDVWTEFEDLTVDRGLWHFLHWRTTATLMMDVRVTGDEREILTFESPLASLWQQMQSAAEDAILARPLCDRYGRLFVEIDTQYMPSRVSVPTVQALTSIDWIGKVEIERAVEPEVGQIDLSGVLYSGGVGVPLFSLSPGHVPFDTGGIEVMDNLALSGQSQANTLAGLVLGRERNEYPEFGIGLASNHRACDICPVQYLEITVEKEDTLRGIILEDFPIVPRAISFDYDSQAGVLLTSIRAEGQTDELPSCNGDLPDCIPVASLPAITTSILDPEGVVYAGQDGGGVQVRSNAGSWSAYNSGLTGDALTVYDLAIDPTTMGEGLASLTAYIATKGGLYKTITGGGSWSKLTLDEPEEGLGEPDVASVKVFNNSILVLAHLAIEEQVWLYRSDDGGESWEWKEILIVSSTVSLEDTGTANNFDVGKKLIETDYISVTSWAVQSGGGARYRDTSQTWTDYSAAGVDLNDNMDVTRISSFLCSAGDDGAVYWDLEADGSPGPTRFLDSGSSDLLDMALVSVHGDLSWGYPFLYALSTTILRLVEPSFSGIYSLTWSLSIPSGGGSGRFVFRSVGESKSWITTSAKIFRLTDGPVLTEEWAGSPAPSDSIFEWEDYYGTIHILVARGTTALLEHSGGTWSDHSIECAEVIRCADAWQEDLEYTIAVGTDTGIYIVWNDEYLKVANLANVKRIACIEEDDEYYILAMTLVGIYRIGPLPGTALTLFVPDDGRAHLMDVDHEGAYVYFGLIDGDDHPVIIRAAADLSVFEVVLQPGAGTWAGVVCDLWDADKLWAFGDMGTDSKIQRSENTGNTWEDVTNGAWGSGELVAWIIPEAFDGNDLLAMLSDAEEVWQSLNGGDLFIKQGDAPFAARCGARGLTFFDLEVAWAGLPTDDTAVVSESEDDGETWSTDQPNGIGTLVLRTAITVEQGAVGQTLTGYCED